MASFFIPIPVLRHMSKGNGTSYERKLRKELEKIGYTVLNLSPSEPGDLIIFKENQFKYIIEVKSVTCKNGKGKYYFSENREQHEQLSRIKLPVLYAVYFIHGGGWKVRPLEECNRVFSSEDGYRIEEFFI